MDYKDLIKVEKNFCQYLQTGDETPIKSYSKIDLNKAIAIIDPQDKDMAWYQEVLRRRDYLERAAEEMKRDKWYQRPLFVGITSAIVTGFFALVSGYMVGVEKTVNNVPIPSNNRQYGNIYAQQIIFNENGTFKINGTALDQATGSTIKFTAVSQDVVTVLPRDPSEVVGASDSAKNSK